MVESSSFHSKLERIARETLAAQAESVDQGNWPTTAMAELQASGLAGLMVPTHLGGLGQGATALLDACYTLGQYCSSSSLCFGMHCVGTAVIAADPNAYQAEHFLKAIAAGKHITTLALSEPKTGSHFYLPECELETSENGYQVNGEKSFVTNGSYADSYVISVANAADSHELSCLIVPNQLEGMEWHGQWQGLGMRGNSSIGLRLNNVELSQEHLLGRSGDQIWYVFNVVAPYFLLAMTGVYLGIAKAAVDHSKEHLQKRQHSGSGNTLAQNSILQFQFAEIWAKLERTYCLAQSAAQKFDEGDETAVLSVMSSKAEVADAATDIVNECMSLCGGIGYREGSLLHKLLRDVRAAHVMSPTTNLLRIWAGRALLEQPLLAD